LAALNLRDLWVHRELLYSLTWRDVKVRYKQTTLGAAWADHATSLHDADLHLLFRPDSCEFRRTESHIPFSPTPDSYLEFFATQSVNSAPVLSPDRNLITKVYFPADDHPGAAGVGEWWNFAIASFHSRILMAWPNGIQVRWTIAVFPLLML